MNTAGKLLPLTMAVIGATVYRRIESQETCPPVEAGEAAVWLTHAANGTRISCLWVVEDICVGREESQIKGPHNHHERHAKVALCIKSNKGECTMYIVYASMVQALNLLPSKAPRK